MVIFVGRNKVPFVLSKNVQVNVHYFVLGKIYQFSLVNVYFILKT
jgi:hypothetical protein